MRFKFLACFLGFLALAVVGEFSTADGATAYYQPTTTLAALAAYGAASPSVSHADVYDVGRYTWNGASTTQCDGVVVVCATGVATGRWILETDTASLSNFAPLAQDNFGGTPGGAWTGRALQVGGSWAVSGSTGATAESVGGGSATGNNLGIYHTYSASGGVPYQLRVGISKANYGSTGDFTIAWGRVAFDDMIHADQVDDGTTFSFGISLWSKSTCTVSTTGASTTIHVSACDSNGIAVPGTFNPYQYGAILSGSGVSGSPTIVSQTSGTPGGNGDYVISSTQTLSSASRVLAVAGRQPQFFISWSSSGATCPSMTSGTAPYTLVETLGSFFGTPTGRVFFQVFDKNGNAVCNADMYDPLVPSIFASTSFGGYLEVLDSNEVYNSFAIYGQPSQTTFNTVSSSVNSISGCIGCDIPAAIIAGAFQMGPKTLLNNAFGVSLIYSPSGVNDHPGVVNNGSSGGWVVASTNPGSGAALYVEDYLSNYASITYANSETDFAENGNSPWLYHYPIAHDLAVFQTDIGVGGRTSSYPELTHSGTTLQVKLADGSANAPLTADSIVLGSATGGNQGAGTLNAAGVYVNGAALSNYTLPAATASVLGGVKPDGTTISNASGAIAVNLANTNAWTAGATFTPSFAATSGTGLVGSPTEAATASSFSGNVVGVNGNPTIGASNTQNWTNTTFGLTGVRAQPSINTSATGTIAVVNGFYTAFTNSSSGTITQVNGLFVGNLSGSNLTNAAAINISQQTFATNNVLINLNNGTMPSGNWGIYEASGYPNYLQAATTFTHGTIIMSGLGSDGGHTSRTLCQDTTSFTLYYGSGLSGICLGTSARRFKQYVHDYTATDLSRVVGLKLFTWRYKPKYGDPRPVHLSVMADDIAKVFPDCLSTDPKGQPLSVDHECIFYHSLKALQELAAKVANDDVRIAQLERVRRGR